MSDHTVRVIFTESGGDQLADKVKRVGQEAGNAHANVGKLEQGMHILQHAVLELAAAFGVHELIKMSDEFTILQMKLGQVTSSTQEMMAVWQDLMVIANKHNADIGATVTAYASLERATKQYGVTTAQAKQAVSSIMEILHETGRSSDDASGALRRLSAALMQGNFSGRAMLTLFTQFPELLEGMAKASGNSVSNFKALAENGSFSMKQLVGFIGQANQFLENHGQHVSLVEGAWTRLKNTATETSGVFSQLTGSSKGLSDVLDLIGDMMKAVVIIAAAIIVNFRRMKDAIMDFLGMVPGFNAFMERLSYHASNWAALWKKGVDAVADDTVSQLQKVNGATGHTAEALDTLGAHEKQAQAAVTQANAALGAHGPALRNAATAANQLSTATDQTRQRVTMMVGGVQKVVEVAREGAQSMDNLTSSDRQAAQSLGQVSQSTGAASTGLVQVGAAADAVGGKITVTRGGMQGFTTEAYENGKAMTDLSGTMQKTTSTIDSLGNTTRVTTQSIRDKDGAVKELKRSVDTLKDGVRTLREFTIMADGSIRQTSESITEATQRIGENTSALSKNAMALGAVTSAASSAASAYSGLGAASAGASGGGGSSGGGGIGQLNLTGIQSDKDWEFAKIVSDNIRASMGTGINPGMFHGNSTGYTSYEQFSKEYDLRHGIAPGGSTGAAAAGGSNLGGYASGGEFTVGGHGGTDTTMVSFMATPGERVSVDTPSQQRAGGTPSASPICVYMTVQGVKDVEGFRKSKNQIMTQLADQMHRAQSQLRRSAQ